MTLHDLKRKINGAGRQNHYRLQVSEYLSDYPSGLYLEEYFNEMLRLESKRTERTRAPFLLLLIDLQHFQVEVERKEVAKKVSDVLFSLTREIDVKGWYKYDRVIGIMFVEMGNIGKILLETQAEISEKLYNGLGGCFDRDRLGKISMSWHVFPDTFNGLSADALSGPDAQTSLLASRRKKPISMFVKRTIDVVASLLGIIVLAPTFLGIAILVKLSSKGPILYKQQRVGLLGKRFVFYKFRSMQVDNDPAIHKEYVKNLMTGGKAGHEASSDKGKVFKIRNDPRVTPFGRFIRKASLDELPQFFNVLKGDMSLVGPRPPIPYEYESYDIWHRRRVLLMKPGITGLWQVRGRSSTTFDEMVRMDIKYIREWSLWLDFKILIRTPLVVLLCKGAY
jgi:lipopolysaccharide/colanic/teichoic acid biosynthesis glycosyltransferase